VLCGAKEPAITVADGAFSCTPQELIDGLNQAVEQADSSVIYSVGAYPGSGNELQINKTYLTLTLNETSAGNLSKIHLQQRLPEQIGSISRPRNKKSAPTGLGVSAK